MEIFAFEGDRGVGDSRWLYVHGTGRGKPCFFHFILASWLMARGFVEFFSQVMAAKIKHKFFCHLSIRKRVLGFRRPLFGSVWTVHQTRRIGCDCVEVAEWSEIDDAIYVNC